MRERGREMLWKGNRSRSSEEERKEGHFASYIVLCCCWFLSAHSIPLHFAPSSFPFLIFLPSSFPFLIFLLYFFSVMLPFSRELFSGEHIQNSNRSRGKKQFLDESSLAKILGERTGERTFLHTPSLSLPLLYSLAFSLSLSYSLNLNLMENNARLDEIFRNRFPFLCRSLCFLVFCDERGLYLTIF